MEKTTVPTLIKYRDKWVRLIAAILGTHIIIVYGEPESSFELMLTKDYYTAFLGSFLIAFVLIELVHFVTSHLDCRYEWVHKAVQRIFAQLLFGLIAPAIVAFLLAIGYFQMRGIDIVYTTYLKYDFQFIFLMLVLINAYYLAYYFYLKWLLAEQAAKNLFPAMAGAEAPVIPDNTVISVSSVFEVSKGASTIPIPTASIAYFFRDNETNYLRTMEGETIYVPQTLDEIESQLDKAMFFRANRQIILSYSAVQRYKVIAYGKIEVQLHPETREPIIVSQKRAPNFRKWCDWNQYESGK